MDEYIERESAKRAVDYAVELSNSEYDAVCNALDGLPAADVAPVVHGKWVWHEEEFEYECSACHCRFDYNHTFELFDHGFQYADYCPHCGAIMGGGDNDAAN